MIWFVLALSAAGGSAIGTAAGFRWSTKQMDAAVQAMTESARSMGLSAQRLVAETALLQFPSLRRAMDLPDDLTEER